MATYHTRQKEAILALLTDSRGEALSASELLARLMRSGSSIGRTTVYRLLSQLV
ncbi:MAG: transcriptional repressor, partial [Sutterella sp.]